MLIKISATNVTLYFSYLFLEQTEKDERGVYKCETSGLTFHALLGIKDILR